MVYSQFRWGQGYLSVPFRKINGNSEWKEGIRIGNISRETVDQTWKPVYGEELL